MANRVIVEKEAIKKAVKTTAIRKICPFSQPLICWGERCQIWDEKNGNCQIENLSKILERLCWVGGGA